MKLSNHEDGAGHRAPALFSFVTLREETFGAILFNPYLAAEVELDQREATVARLCDGAHTPADLRQACGRILDLDSVAVCELLQETLGKLNRVCALDQVEPRAAPVPSVQREPVPAGSAATLSAPKSVIWDVTYACNLSCPHCLTDSGTRRPREMDTGQALEFIDRLAASRVLYLSLTGGEPFLRGDILDLLARIEQCGMRVDIASNGLRVPERIIRGLRNLPIFQIQVSIDGIGEAHDRFRGQPGCFESACRTLRRFKEEGLITSISTTATAQNVDQLAELIDLAVSLGCDAFKAIPFIPAGRGRHHQRDLWLDRQGSLKLSQTLARKSRELEGQISISTESTFLFLLDPTSCIEQEDGAMICSAGYDELSVGADGAAYPCPFLRDFPLGNLLQQPMEQIWHESATLNELRLLSKTGMTGACSTCRFAPEHCRGGCRAAAFLSSGRLNASDPLCFKELLDRS